MAKITTVSDLFPSRFIRSSDIGDSDLALTIVKVDREEFGDGDHQETKPVLHFKETDKLLVLNVTNANTIADLYGNTVIDWSGKRIALFVKEVDFKGRQVMGIRIRMRPPEQLPDTSQIDPEIPF